MSVSYCRREELSLGIAEGECVNTSSNRGIKISWQFFFWSVTHTHTHTPSPPHRPSSITAFSPSHFPHCRSPRCYMLFFPPPFPFAPFPVTWFTSSWTHSIRCVHTFPLWGARCALLTVGVLRYWVVCMLTKSTPVSSTGSESKNKRALFI